MKIAILGAGAYGIALSSIFYRNKHDVVLYTPLEEEAKMLLETHKSDKLPEYLIPEDILVTTNFEQAVSGSKIIVMCVPAFAVNSTAHNLSKIITNEQHILIASKGIEQESCSFLTEVIRKHINSDRCAIISGPTFAADVVKNVPIGLSIAGINTDTIELIKTAMSNDTTKLRETSDVIGLEICGSVKNVIAIASGILKGMNVTPSTQALFLTESLNDIKVLIEALGGDKRTIVSFAGFGDIYMTCSSEASRNFTYGKMIGEGRSKEEIESYRNNTTIEGLYTLSSVYKLIKDRNVNIPIIDLINDIIN